MTTVLRSRLTDRPELFIGGRWTASQGGAPVLISRPADQVAVGTATLATEADIDAAVTSARAEAVATANDSDYGLAGSVWSADEDAALSIARRIRTGMVSINGYPQAFGSPLGGFKQSGIGRELGPEGYAGYLETQSIALGGGSLT
jgi:acyl-CoA reductase-like NAD-dependent aldehyde dehydrogenase